MILEARKHAGSVFVTLTYSQEKLPTDLSLNPRHVALWLKRLRKEVGVRFRYYLVGEYGMEKGRPHYHCVLFGLEHALCVLCANNTRRFRTPSRCNCTIFKTWGMGAVEVAELNTATANYCAKYVTKKLEDELFRERECSSEKCKYRKDRSCPNAGRYPTFTRSSRRPGIGGTAVKDIAEVLNSTYGADEILRTGDVPMALLDGRKSFPLGRYIRMKLREEVGLDAEKVKDANMLRWSQEQTEVIRERNITSTNISIKNIFTEEGKQEALKMEKRLKIFEKRGKL